MNNDFKCPICGRNFQDCSHSHKDIEDRKVRNELDKRIRKIVRDEIKKNA